MTTLVIEGNMIVSNLGDFVDNYILKTQLSRFNNLFVVFTYVNGFVFSYLRCEPKVSISKSLKKIII